MKLSKSHLMEVLIEAKKLGYIDYNYISEPLENGKVKVSKIWKLKKDE